MKNNKKLLIVVSILLVSIGVSFAYFVTRIVLNGTGAKVEGITATIEGSTLNVVGNISFNDLNILPGHKNISSIKVTATGNNELVPYNLIWRGTNRLNTPLNYIVYKTSSNISVTASCEKKEELENGKLLYKEECTISNIELLGSKISEGTISNTDTKVVLTNDEFITSTTTGEVVYYYIIFEYPNLEESQNTDLNGSFNGQVTVESSNVTPDINILGVYIKASDGSYEKADSIPESGYNLNSIKTTCSNGATVTYDNGISINNLTTSGVSCTLYFDENKIASEYLLSNNELVNENGYRYEGASPNNYVAFNGELWRIIGVFNVENSDTGKTENLVKLIRNESIGKLKWDNYVNKWTESSLRSLLAGVYYNRTSTYSENGLTIESRNMIQKIVWKLGGADTNQLAVEEFYKKERGSITYGANPSTSNGYVGLMYPSDYGYAADASSCPRTTRLDLYSKTECKNSNWLFNSETQWTLTHYSDSSNFVFHVDSSGDVDYYAYANGSIGVRPSVYLKSTVVITGGDGTQSNPYKIS